MLLAVLAFVNRAGAEPFEMDVVETEDLRLLYFDPFQTHLVPHVIRNFQNSLDFQKRVFEWRPEEKTTVILMDPSDYGNAGAGASPYNGVSVYIAPASRTLETMPSSERIFMIMNHELVHVANMDVANAEDLKWRHFFGGKPRQTDRHPESILYNYLTIPRLNAPRWYLEGAAVFMETWMSGGIGRAQGAYDEMVFRSMVRDDAYFYSNLGIVSEGTSVDFQAGVNAYLYGTRFVSYLALEYSPEQVIEWLKRENDSERYYSKQFLKVFGKPLEEAWDDWIAFEHVFQKANLESVRQQPLTEARRLTSRMLGSISRSYVDEDRNELIGAFRYPGVVAHVGVLSLADDRLRRIADIKGPMTYRVTSSAWDPATRTFFYTADNLAFRDLMAVDVDTGKERMLLRDARIGDIVYSPADRSIWGLRHLNGYVSLVQIPYPYKEWHLVYDWPYGQVAYELDISADGHLLSASLGEIDGSQHLKVFRIADLRQGNATAVAEFDFSPAVPEGFVFSPDSRYLYGSSFYTGVSNIFRFEIATGELEAVSNAETGLFRPVPLRDGSLAVFEYTGQGFVPAVIQPETLEDLSSITFLGSEIARRHPVVKDWNAVTGLKDIRYEELIVHRGKYRPYRELDYDSGYPVVEGYRDTEALGWHFQFTDPAQLHRFGLTGSYSAGDLPSSERLHLDLEYKALNWYARYRHNRADFYDLFGPTERSRKGDAYTLGYDRALIFDEPRRLDFAGALSYYTGLDTLPGNQNVPALAIEDILSIELGLHYTDTRKSIGAVDHEKGLRWNVMLDVDDSEFDTVVKPYLGLDLGFALPWKHSSIWFYNSAGITNGDRADPLGNFYFGGFGNNYVDDGEVKRYREYDRFPGFEIDEIVATDFVKSVAEWNLPPIRFREVGKPGFFLSHIRPAVFFGALLADPGESFERTVTTLGTQLDLSFTLVHRLPMTLSVGFAAGFENGERGDDEWMVSLKIL
ncbi:MAG: TolB family protein [Woeseiaceae bacterium]